MIPLPFLRRRVAILCAQTGSVYNELPGCDVYCRRRDAFTFTGSCPVIAHPPCRSWGRLRHFVRNDDALAMEMYLGRFCVDQVRRFGGVVEHPAYSTLWQDQGLPRPGEFSPEGCTVSILQSWFGHRAPKATWIFVAGLKPIHLPTLPFALEDRRKFRAVEHMSRREREHTPISLAQWLLQCAVLSGRVDRYHWNGQERPARFFKDRPRTDLKERAGCISQEHPELFTKGCFA